MAHGCTYCTDDFHCEKFTSEKCVSWCYGKDYPCKDRRISNADRIRSMTDEELVNQFTETMGFCCPVKGVDCSLEPDCRMCFDRWLKQEVTE